MWARSQALAAALAAKGQSVIYFEPLSFRQGIVSLVRMCDFRMEDQIKVVTPRCLPLPQVRTYLLSRFGLAFLYDIQRGMLSHQLARHKPTDGPTVAMFNHPFQFRNVEGIGADLLVYDCCDRFEEMPYIDPQEVLIAEREALAGSDIVLTSSKELYDDKRRKHSRVLFLPNALDPRLLGFDRSRPNDLPDGSGPIVGFTGTIADWIDLDLVREVALRRPNYRFILVGPVAPGVSLHRLSGISNVRFVGAKPWQSLAGYYAGFDVAINPMRISELTHAVNPVKFYEYLAFGIPTVSTPIREGTYFDEHVFWAAAPDEFVDRLDEALNTDSPEHRARRMDFALANTWAVRAEQLISVVLDPAKSKTCV